MTYSSRPFAAALIVDDQPFPGLVASDILRETGFKTFHASEASDALDLLRSHPEIELMVTEADLAGPVDGIELTRRAAEQRPGLRVVVTSRSAEARPFEVPAGARLLHKPYSSAELRTMVAGMALLQDA